MLVTKTCGQRIRKVIVHLPRIVRLGKLRDLEGRRICRIERYGKLLAFRTDLQVTLFAHLGMTGTFLWQTADADRSPHHRASLFLDKGVLVFRDIRTLGGLWVVADGQIPLKVLGLDPFDRKLNPQRIKSLFARRSNPIKAVLLDQSLIAGVGNIYASESLFAAEIHPDKPANQLTQDECSRLLCCLRRILKRAIESGGTTFCDFKLSDGSDGGFRDFLKVYGKDGEPCPRCKRTILRTVIRARSTFYCPACQPIESS